MKEELGHNELSKRLAAVIDTAIDGIITIDANGIIETFNLAASKIFGFSSEEVCGQNISILMPTPYKKEHDGYIANYHRTKKPKIIGIGRDIVGQKKDGTIFPMRLAVSEVILNDRIIFTGIVHDLSDLQVAHRELEEVNARLEQKVEERTVELEEAVNKLLGINTELKESRHKLEKALSKEKELGELKSRFVSIASHEFRTPLASILSSAAIIQKYQTSEQQEKRDKHIGRIKSSVQNLTGILEDFLSLSKLEQKAITVDHSDFDIVELLEEVREDVAGIIKDNQEIKIIAEDHSDHITSDRRVLKNIMFNLISNAIKYSDEDIVCKVKRDGDSMTIDVIDRGIGIPEEDQKHLFTDFFRASNVSNIKGTGLGLNIIKRYLQLLEGDISFVSEENKGTTFTVTITT